MILQPTWRTLAMRTAALIAAFFGAATVLSGANVLFGQGAAAAGDYVAPASPITGEAAYDLYIEHALPFVKQSGGEIVFYGKGGQFLIGPPEERWDAALLVRQTSVASFLAFASNKDYLGGIGHRLAALQDSRLLPLIETTGM